MSVLFLSRYTTQMSLAQGNESDGKTIKKKVMSVIKDYVPTTIQFTVRGTSTPLYTSPVFLSEALMRTLVYSTKA